MQISYNHPDNGWINEQYVGDNTAQNLQDSEFVKDGYWANLSTEETENILISFYKEQDLKQYFTLDGKIYKKKGISYQILDSSNYIAMPPIKVIPNALYYIYNFNRGGEDVAMFLNAKGKVVECTETARPYVFAPYNAVFFIMSIPKANIDNETAIYKKLSFADVPYQNNALKDIINNMPYDSMVNFKAGENLFRFIGYGGKTNYNIANSNPSLRVLPNYINTGIIPISVGDIYYANIYLSGGASDALIGYDESGNYVKSIWGQGEYKKQVYIHTDNNIKYVIATTIPNELESSFFKKVNGLSENQNRLLVDEFITENDFIVGGNYVNRDNFPYTAENVQNLTAFEIKPAYMSNQSDYFLLVELEFSVKCNYTGNYAFGGIANILPNTKVILPLRYWETRGYALYLQTDGGVSCNAIIHDIKIVSAKSKYHNRSVIYKVVTEMPIDNFPADSELDMLNTIPKINGSIVALGNSITAGQGTYFSFATAISEYLQYSLTNLGIPGATFQTIYADDNLNKFPEWVDIALLSGGTNGTWVDADINSDDRSTPAGCINYAMQKIYGINPAAVVIFVTPPYSANSGQLERAKQFNSFFKQMGEKWGVPVIDTLHNAGMNALNISNSEVTIDGIHPTVKYHKRIADMILNALPIKM